MYSLPDKDTFYLNDLQLISSNIDVGIFYFFIFIKLIMRNVPFRLKHFH